MADEPLPAVPSYRLTLPQFGDRTEVRATFRLSTPPARPVALHSRAAVDEVIASSHRPTRAELTASSPPQSTEPALRLPLINVAGTTVLRLGDVMLTGATITGQPNDPLTGVGGGVSLLLGNEGDGGVFLNVLGTPLGSFAAGFRLSGH